MPEKQPATSKSMACLLRKPDPASVVDCGYATANSLRSHFKTFDRGLKRDAADLKSRTKVFALRIVRLCEALPKSSTSDVIGKQLIRCGTSAGANYRAACRGRSRRDFAAKRGIVEKEYDEAIYGLELIVEAGLMEEKCVADLKDGAIRSVTA